MKMDPSEAVKDNTIDLTSDTENVQDVEDVSKHIVRTDLEGRLSFSADNSELISCENKTDFIGSILKDSYQGCTNVDSTSRTANVALVSSDNANTLNTNTEVLQSSLLEYCTEPHLLKDDKMDVDDDDSKSNEGAVIVSEDSVSSVKDICLPGEIDLTKSYLEVPELQSNILSESKDCSQSENDMMETDDNDVTKIEERLEKSETVENVVTLEESLDKTETDQNIVILEENLNKPETDEHIATLEESLQISDNKEVVLDIPTNDAMDTENEVTGTSIDSDESVSDSEETKETDSDSETVTPQNEDEQQIGVVEEPFIQEATHTDALETMPETSNEVEQNTKEAVEEQVQVRDTQIVEINDDVEEIQEISEEEETCDIVDEVHDALQKIHGEVEEIRDDIDILQNQAKLIDHIDATQDSVEEILDDDDDAEQMQIEPKEKVTESNEVKEIQDEVQELQLEKDTKLDAKESRIETKELQVAPHKIQEELSEIQRKPEESELEPEEAHRESEESQLKLEEAHRESEESQLKLEEAHRESEVTQLEPEKAHCELGESPLKPDEASCELEESQLEPEEPHCESKESEPAQFESEKTHRDLEETQLERKETQPEVEQSQCELEENPNQSEKIQPELKETQGELEDTRSELEQSKCELEEKQSESEETEDEVEETQSEPKETQLESEVIQPEFEELQRESETNQEIAEREVESEKGQLELKESQIESEELQRESEESQHESEETHKSKESQIESEQPQRESEETHHKSEESQCESEETHQASEETLQVSEETHQVLEEKQHESQETLTELEEARSVDEKTPIEAVEMETEQIEIVERTEPSENQTVELCSDSDSNKVGDIEETDDVEMEQHTVESANEVMETESEMMETDSAVIETENEMAVTESVPTEVESIEETENDAVVEKDIVRDIENAKEVLEPENTVLAIDSVSVESTSTSKQIELKVPEQNIHNDDVSVEQPSSTTETKSDDNVKGSNECETTDNLSAESSTENSVTNIDVECNITSSKNADKSSELPTKSGSNDQGTVNADENAKGSESTTEVVMVTSNDIDQTNDEDENGSNPVFVHVDTENDKNTADKTNETTLPDNRDEFQESQPQEDPIASDDFVPASLEDDAEELDQPMDDPINYEQTDEEQGASEEMCIIPDTERVISQAERDAAAGMVPLCDPTESEAFSSDPSSDGISGDTSSEKRKTLNPENYIVSVCIDEKVNACMQCCLPRKSKYSVLHNKKTSHVCDDGCLNNFKRRHGDKVIISTEGDLRVKKLTSGVNNDNMVAKVKFRRKCSECLKKLTLNETHLSWETMEFCNELCLSKYQKKVASNCSNCQVIVRNNCLGKYCVRFGYDIRQFCSSICLEEYKKGLKVCSYCQKDMSSGGGDGFLAPVGDKGQFKDFCTQLCMEKYDVMSNNRRQAYKPGSTCSVCLNEKPITIEFDHNGKVNLFCGEPCFVAFKFVNNITPAKCNMCKKYFDNKILEEHSMFYDNALHSFCSKSCQNIYIIGHRKIVPCSWCKVKKYNFDMIKRSSATGSSLLMCSLNCLSLYQVSVNAVQSKKTKCDHCQKTLQPLYHLTMSDATMRNFCSYPCVMAFQNQFPKTPITLNEPEESSVPVPTGGPKRSKRTVPTKQPEPASSEAPTIPVISSVQSLATANGPTTGTQKTRPQTNSDSSVSTSPPVVKTQIKQHFIIKPVPIPPQRNIGTLCKVNMQTKSVSCKPTTCNKEVQTDEIQEKTALIPIPVPIYVPAPMWMYSMPFPVPFPFPLPVPVPIFIPTTRNSANGIMKEIKKIQVKIPTDPFEAELLMMAEMVAGDKKEEHTDSESEEEDTAPPPDEATFSPEPVDASNTFGDDMLQMALKMATELDEPAVDLEGALTANTITASQGPEPAAVEEPPEEPQPIHHIMERQAVRGRKRPGRPPKTGGTVSKRGRRSSSQMEIPIMAPPQPPPPPEPVEKPDANMCLKYTFGVNAWKQWVTTKNAELEKTSRRVKLFKPEILQLTADELNYSLCLFVKEVRKPNGQEYAPDTIYYLCLGIQQYLFENARIDNIFCDSYYEKFTDCLDEVAKKFSILYNDSHYIVTRVEEEHLWESKQLGAHSPHVLLSTLMFFNTKHFNLTTVDEHMQLSFSHIMKHWKRNSHNQPGTAKMVGSRNVLLRFYPPQTNSTDAAQRKKKVYEQQENEDNPLRCPVKLYEFYLSKCPESVKTRNDVFYLLPERSCVPDSPVWYSTMPLPRAALEKMLHRVKMVKEINVALLTS